MTYSKTNTYRRARQMRHGTTVAEVAFIVPVVLLLLLGIADCAQMIYAYDLVSEAARIGGRYAIVHGSGSSSPVGPTANDANLQSYILNYATVKTLNTSQLTVTSSWPMGANDPTCPVTVTVTYNYPLIIGRLIGTPSVSLNGSTTMVITY